MLLQYVGNYQCRRCHFPDYCNRHQNRLWKLSNRIKCTSLQPQEFAVDRALTVVIHVTFRIAWFLYLWAGIAQSVLRLATGWKVRFSNPGWGGWDFLHPSRPPLGAHSASCTMGTGSFPGVKRPGRGVDRPPPLCAEVKEGIEYTSAPPLGFRGLF